MERKIGDEFEMKLRVRVVKSERPCVGCIFRSSFAYEELNGLGNCGTDARTYGKHIHFEIVSSYNV